MQHLQYKKKMFLILDEKKIIQFFYEAEVAQWLRS